MGRYDINIKNIIAGLLPTSLRGNVIELLSVFTSPIGSLYIRFTNYREKQLDNMSYNAQYPHLQRLLNDRFDAAARRIRVYDRLQLQVVVVYPDEAVLPVELPVRIYPELTYFNRGFIVEVPTEYENTDTIKQIQKTVNTYKFAGIYYEIIYT